MHIHTHIISGWCAGRHFSFTARERFLSMLAASLPDLDGLGAIFYGEIRIEGFRIIASGPHYQAFHHIVGHNIFAGIVISLTLLLFSRRKLFLFFFYLAMFHLHLLLDVIGSGVGWGIRYLWPVSDYSFEVPWSWELGSWQNSVALFVIVGWTLWLVNCYKSTPLECISPKLDKKIVAWVSNFVAR